MKNNKSSLIFIIIGLYFLLMAFDISLPYTLFSYGIAAILLIASFILIKRSNYFGFFASLFLAIYFLKDIIGLNDLSVWQLILPAIFLSIGFNIMFSRRVNNHYNYNRDYQSQDTHYTYHKTYQDNSNNETIHDENNIRISNNFGAKVRYVNSQAFEHGNISSNFGEVNVFFTSLELDSDIITIDLTSNFSEMSLFFPPNIIIVDELNVLLAQVKNNHRSDENAHQRIILRGNITLSELNISIS